MSVEEVEKLIEVHDVAGRKYRVKRKNLKPSTWIQGADVFTRI